MLKCSYDYLVYFGENVNTSIKRVSKHGCDAIELVGEPDDYNAYEVKSLCKDNGIVVSSICSIFNEKGTLSPRSRQKETRRSIM